MKTFSTLFLILALSVSSFAQSNSKRLPEAIRNTADASTAYYFDIYKTLHTNPELSLQEKETSALIAREMRQLGLEVTEQVGGYGVVGILRNGEGPVIMLRADMDALPVEETTGLPYASTKKVSNNGVETPVMHACGHDMHSTVLLGTLSAMVKHKKAWKGTILAVAQPAEEVGKGSRALIADGLFTRFPCPDMALGFHVGPEFAAGTVAYTKGPALAGVRDIDITFYGKGSHGAFPHEGNDPIIMAASAVLEFQTIISRNIIASEPAVITVGSFNGGYRPNIIPNEVRLLLTARYFNDEVGNLIEKRITEICLGTAQSYGAPKEPLIVIHDMLPPVINNPELTDKALEAMATIIGKENLIESPIHMVAEDFANYAGAIAAQKGDTKPAPTVLFWLGASPSVDEVSGPLHSPTFHPEFEKAFQTGVATMTAALIRLL